MTGTQTEYSTEALSNASINTEQIQLKQTRARGEKSAAVEQSCEVIVFGAMM